MSTKLDPPDVGSWREDEQHQRNRRTRWIAAIVVIALLVAAGVAFATRSPADDVAPPAAVTHTQTLTVVDVGSGGTTTLTVPDGAHDFDASLDGSMLAYVDQDADGADQVFVMSADGSGVRQVTTGQGGVSTDDGTGPIWSPDRSMIAYARTTAEDGQELFVVDVADGVSTRITREAEGVVGPAGWTADGGGVYYSVPNFDLDHYTTNSVDLATGRSRIVIEDGSGPAASPDGRLLAFNSWVKPDPLVRLMVGDDRGADRRVVARLTGQDALQRWSPDSSRLAYMGDDGFEVLVYDLATGATTSAGVGVLEGWLDAEHLLVS